MQTWMLEQSGEKRGHKYEVYYQKQPASVSVGSVRACWRVYLGDWCIATIYHHYLPADQGYDERNPREYFKRATLYFQAVGYFGGKWGGNKWSANPETLIALALESTNGEVFRFLEGEPMADKPTRYGHVNKILQPRR